MGCNCGGKASSWKVTFPDGSSQTYLTRTEALAAVSGRGGGTIRQISL